MKPRFFIAQPGDPAVSNCNDHWTQWEVGDDNGRERVCLTSCKTKARMIADALEAFHTEKRKDPDQ